MKLITIKTETSCIQEHPKINKVIATIDAKNTAKLLDVVGLTANPRKSKKNKITTAICETLKTSPKDMRFKSKGLLISTMECQPLQRGRYKISFEDPTFEGVLDGGHNMLAIGLYILEEFFGEETHSELRKIRQWDDFIEVWKKYRNKLDELLDLFEFQIPIEIIYPTEEYKPNFIDSVLDISDARNNNSALTTGTKADHRGHYKILKESLVPEIFEKVEWKDGDSGKTIKRDDIVSMALIPLIALQEAGKLSERVPKINPMNIYSNKGKCVELFSTIYEEYSDEDGEISNSLIISALGLLSDLPNLFDTIYEKFPRSARDNGLHFGRINTVKLYEKGKKGNSYLSKPPRTKYYGRECEAKYPDGFILPIFSTLHAMIKIDNKSVKWAIPDPVKFINDNLTECTRMLVSSIRENDYNPQSVGKSIGAYEGMKINYQLQLTKL